MTVDAQTLYSNNNDQPAIVTQIELRRCGNRDIVSTETLCCAVAQDENAEDDDAAEEDALCAPAPVAKMKARAKKGAKMEASKASWVGPATSTSAGVKFYQCVKVLPTL